MIGFPVTITPELVRLTTEKYHLEEIRLRAVNLRTKNRLCDRAFAYYFAKNESLKKLSFDTYQDEDCNLPGFVDAYTLGKDSLVPIASLDDGQLQSVSLLAVCSHFYSSGKRSFRAMRRPRFMHREITFVRIQQQFEADSTSRIQVP